MKEHNIDQLFQQKLKEHRVSPTPAAWDQVAQGLHSTRRRKRGVYYAAAAAMALLFTTAWLFLQPNSITQPRQPGNLAVQVQENITVTEKPYFNTAPSQQLEETQQAVASPATPEEVAPSKRETGNAPKMMATAKTININANSRKAVNAQKTKVQPTQRTPLETGSESLLVQALPIAPGSQSTKAEIEEPKEIKLPATETLMAKAEDVVIRYESASAVEEAPEKPQEKVLSFLQKVKQGEIGLADVRQAKDNLLSGKLNKP